MPKEPDALNTWISIVRIHSDTLKQLYDEINNLRGESAELRRNAALLVDLTQAEKDANAKDRERVEDNLFLAYQRYRDKHNEIWQSLNYLAEDSNAKAATQKFQAVLKTQRDFNGKLSNSEVIPEIEMYLQACNSIETNELINSGTVRKIEKQIHILQVESLLLSAQAIKLSVMGKINVHTGDPDEDSAFQTFINESYQAYINKISEIGSLITNHDIKGSDINDRVNDAKDKFYKEAANALSLSNYVAGLFRSASSRTSVADSISREDNYFVIQYILYLKEFNKHQEDLTRITKEIALSIATTEKDELKTQLENQAVIISEINKTLADQPTNFIKDENKLSMFFSRNKETFVILYKDTYWKNFIDFLSLEFFNDQKLKDEYGYDNKTFPKESIEDYRVRNKRFDDSDDEIISDLREQGCRGFCAMKAKEWVKKETQKADERFGEYLKCVFEEQCLGSMITKPRKTNGVTANHSGVGEKQGNRPLDLRLLQLSLVVNSTPILSPRMARRKKSKESTTSETANDSAGSSLSSMPEALLSPRNSASISTSQPSGASSLSNTPPRHAPFKPSRLSGGVPTNPALAEPKSEARVRSGSSSSPNTTASQRRRANTISHAPGLTNLPEGKTTTPNSPLTSPRGNQAGIEARASLAELLMTSPRRASNEQSVQAPGVVSPTSPRSPRLPQSNLRAQPSGLGLLSSPPRASADQVTQTASASSSSSSARLFKRAATTSHVQREQNPLVTSPPRQNLSKQQERLTTEIKLAQAGLKK